MAPPAIGLFGSAGEVRVLMQQAQYQEPNQLQQHEEGEQQQNCMMNPIVWEEEFLCRYCHSEIGEMDLATDLFGNAEEVLALMQQ
mmetsp:Transcript_11978/g.26252  ORF Transcript_11978/g.26252 Transcript_11978/m.26252 type:complete len:85 (+) Transcript_11978:3222-3476(+)